MPSIAVVCPLPDFVIPSRSLLSRSGLFYVVPTFVMPFLALAHPFLHFVMSSRVSLLIALRVAQTQSADRLEG